jgi:hypothetical protein
MQSGKELYTNSLEMQGTATMEGKDFEFHEVKYK